METVGVAHCQSCRAVVNLNWSVCFACQKPLAETSRNWLSAWRELANLTLGITGDDPRFKPIMALLEQCDTAYLANDWPAFQQASEHVKVLVEDRLA